ncbi:MAG: DUF342 domain-containing protein [Planctomycetes bacterium]|nr:DUF342 domain-containing protein [Planctomycetota bacterium]
MSTQASPKAGLVVVTVAKDLMTATIHLQDPAHAAGLDVHEVSAALSAEGVVVDDAVRKRVEAFITLARSGQPQPEGFVAAKGLPASNGKSEAFAWDPDLQSRQAEWQSDAPVNYYALNSIITVEKDAPLGTLTPLVPSRPGRNVKGEPVDPTVEPEPLVIGDTIRRCPDDPCRLISNLAGKVVQKGQHLSIEEVLLVTGDVNFAIGNIDSTTAVHIQGSVLDRFEVRSRRSIIVGGEIEAAVVVAGEDVVVRNGIISRNVGSVVAKFCSEAVLSCAGDLAVISQLLNCRARTDGELQAEQASIIGGQVYARLGGRVGVLGSDAGIPTRVFLGVRPNALVEIVTIDDRIQRTRDVIQGIRHTVQPLLDNLKRLTPTQREKATELMFKAEEAQAQVESEGERRQQILEAAGGNGNPRLIVSTSIQSGVTISLGTRVTVFREELKGPVSIEQRKIRNVTELVAVNTLTGSVQILTSQKMPLDVLNEQYEPLSALNPPIRRDA